jgi:FkbM family methyltransferase
MINFSSIDNESLLGRFLRFPLKWMPDRRSVPVLQGVLQGMAWLPGAATHGCWLGSFEVDKQRRVFSSIRYGDVFYDVGANVGFYTLLASRGVGTGGTVIAFEPLPRNLSYLLEHLELNEVENVRVLATAVSETDGFQPFESGAGPCQAKLGQQASLHVSKTSLDELVFERDLPPPDVLKIDIEGGEYSMLKGATKVLEQHEPELFLATHGPKVRRQCHTFLSNNAYEVESLDGSELDRTDEFYARPSA